MNNYTNERIEKKRKLKFGALAVTLTVVVVALVIVINAIFTALAGKYMWYADMTDEFLFTISDATKNQLAEFADDPNLKIKIIFCMDPDQLDQTFQYRLVRNMAEQFASEFEFIETEYVPYEKHPSYFEKFLSTSVTEINSKYVIITDGSTSKACTMDWFFYTSQSTGSLYAFDGEYKFLSSFLSITGDNPIAYFTTGHGESVQNSTMFELFKEAGFDVRTIDLSKEDMEEGTMCVVINNPKYDFMGADDTVNEIAKIDKVLDDRGNLMVFLDAKERSLPELDALLYEWGIVFENSKIRDYDNSLSVDGTELVADYVTSGSGASLTEALRKLETTPKMIVKDARPIKLLFGSEGYKDRYASSILQTFGSAYAVPFGESEENGEYGVYDLMTISYELKYINNVDCYNYVLAAGTSSFADDKYVGSSSYGNRDLIFNIMKNFGKKTVPVDIDFKVFDDTMLDITTSQAKGWTIVLTAVIPTAVLACGLVVFIRRRRK